MAGGDRPEAPSLGDRRRERLDRARLYLILESRPGGRPPDELLERALDGGVDVVQLRDKLAEESELVEVARIFRAACDRHGALFVVNDRPDLALECRADGVHVGQDDATVDEARALLGEDALIGISTHTSDQVVAARESLADYLAVGPVHATPTKPGREPVGEELIRFAASEARKPFFAIGGIDTENVATAAIAGAARVAVVRAIRDADDPGAAAAALRGAVAGGRRDGAAGSP